MNAESGMIFTYWINDATAHDESTEAAPPSMIAWREQYPEASVYSDSDVLKFLDRFGQEYGKLYRRIRIPACKSDIARLVLLYHLGGFYLDSHTGPGEAKELTKIFAKLAAYDVVFFDKTWEHQNENDIHLINGAICSRRGSPLIKKLIDTVFNNLELQEKKENEYKKYVPYNLAVLTGAWVLRLLCFSVNESIVSIRPEFADQLYLYRMTIGKDPGFILYKHYSYRKEGRHWSERQGNELLFEPREI
jgi:hypothetical protein